MAHHSHRITCCKQHHKIGHIQVILIKLANYLALLNKLITDSGMINTRLNLLTYVITYHCLFACSWTVLWVKGESLYTSGKSSLKYWSRGISQKAAILESNTNRNLGYRIYCRIWTGVWVIFSDISSTESLLPVVTLQSGMLVPCVGVGVVNLAPGRVAYGKWNTAIQQSWWIVCGVFIYDWRRCMVLRHKTRCREFGWRAFKVIMRWFWVAMLWYKIDLKVPVFMLLYHPTFAN